jgi:hypothetical protein
LALLPESYLDHRQRKKEINAQEGGLDNATLPSDKMGARRQLAGATHDDVIIINHVTQNSDLLHSASTFSFLLSDGRLVSPNRMLFTWSRSKRPISGL